MPSDKLSMSVTSTTTCDNDGLNVNGTKEKDLSSTNLESSVDLEKRNETYSSLTKDINVLQKSPKKKNPPKQRKSAKLLKASPSKTDKSSAHLAQSDKELKVEMTSRKISTARKRTYVKAADTVEIKKDLVVKRGRKKKKVEETNNPISISTPVKTMVTRKRKAAMMDSEEIKKSPILEQSNRNKSKREASKRAKLNISSFINEKSDLDD